MAKKIAKRTQKKKLPAGRIVLRTGEALVEAEPAWSAAEPEVVIGELTGPVGYAIANLMGNQVKGHTKVFAILNSDVQVRPATVMVSKVTVSSEKYTNILMGTVQAAIAHGVLDAVRAGDIPKNKVNDLGIIISVWLDPSVVSTEIDPAILFQTNREATTKAIHKAMHHEPSIDWLLKNQDSVLHYFHQLAVDKQL
jgi:formaldehyde-activating enzyme